jgi:hypothetical protein
MTSVIGDDGFAFFVCHPTGVPFSAVPLHGCTLRLSRLGPGPAFTLTIAGSATAKPGRRSICSLEALRSLFVPGVLAHSGSVAAARSAVAMLGFPFKINGFLAMHNGMFCTEQARAS